MKTWVRRIAIVSAVLAGRGSSLAVVPGCLPISKEGFLRRGRGVLWGGDFGFLVGEPEYKIEIWDARDL